MNFLLSEFLLTRPSRDVTRLPAALLKFQVFLLTRPSRDVTRHFTRMESTLTFLLTRPSRDVTLTGLQGVYIIIFLLTRPSRDVTHQRSGSHCRNIISTHTPLAGRDLHPTLCR